MPELYVTIAGGPRILGEPYINGVHVVRCWDCRAYVPVDRHHTCERPDGGPLVAFLRARLDELADRRVADAIGAVVALHWDESWLPGQCRVCAESVGHLDDEHDAAPCDTLKALAGIFADHPDYREKWSL